MIGLLLLALAQPAASNGDVILQHRITPDEIVETVAGRCGRNRYEVRLAHLGERSVLTVEVNRRPVPRAQIAEAMKLVPAGFSLFQPFVAECFRDRPNARMRLIVDGPRSGGHSRFLYFEVTPGGKVTNALLD